MLHYRIFPSEIKDETAKFLVLNSGFMKKHLLDCRIKRRYHKYVCINQYKILVINNLVMSFLDHYLYISGGRKLTSRCLLKVSVFGSILEDTLSSKIDILKKSLTLLEVYAFVKFLRVNCVLFDHVRAIHYQLNSTAQTIVLFRFNNPFDVHFCGVYDNIYHLLKKVSSYPCIGGGF